ncbi:hypothetical protein [Guggenheimella bovis]
MQTIHVLGDSITKGIILKDGRYEILETSFISQLKNEGMAIKNYSNFGCTVKKGLSNFEKHKGKILPGDTVGIEFGGNDSNFDWKSINDSSRRKVDLKTL